MLELIRRRVLHTVVVLTNCDQYVISLADFAQAVRATAW